MYAGGAILALAHDFRIMTGNQRFKFCMSEVNIGLTFPYSAHSLFRAVLSPQAQRIILLGTRLSGAEALKVGAITGLFTERSDSEK